MPNPRPTPARRPRLARPLAAWLVAALLLPVPAAAAEPPDPTVDQALRRLPARTEPAALPAPTRLIVKFRDGLSAERRSRVRAAAGVSRSRSLDLIRAEVVRPGGRSLGDALEALRRHPDVEWVQVDARRTTAVDPEAEPFYVYQWGVRNTAQVLPFGIGSGTSDVDIDGELAYPHATGSGVVVAVIDDGVDFSHPDLEGQAWVNPGESGDGKETNGVDDDGNGRIDDVHGWDVCNDDASLFDTGDEAHGTAVASIIAAASDTEGMIGVAPDARIMGVKFLDDGFSPCNTDSYAIEAIEYASAMGAKIINASWGGDGDSPALQAAIEASGALFVTAAGNTARDIDLVPSYPAAFPSTNVLSVASIDFDGELADHSNFGNVTVDISAPGQDILTAFRGPGFDAGDPGDDDIGWAFGSGTSFATPHVTGIAALIAEERPDLLADPAALKAKILASGWANVLTSGLTVSGRSADARRAVDVTAPIQGMGTVRPLANRTMGSTTTTVRISWPAATDDLAVGAYVVRFRRIGGGWSTTTLPPTVRWLDRSLDIGTAYEAQVQARDLGGNLSAPILIPVRALRYQETSAFVTRTSGWFGSLASSASGGRTIYATTAGRSATFRFTGRAVGFVTTTGPTRGSARVYIDGSLAATISLRTSTTRYRQLVYSRAWTTPGTHTIRIVVVGTPGRPRVDVDAFVITK